MRAKQDCGAWQVYIGKASNPCAGGCSVHRLLPATARLAFECLSIFDSWPPPSFAFLREAARVAGVHFQKSMWCLRYETGEMTGRDHHHCLLSVRGSPWVQLATCFYLMDFWDKKLGCGHARVRIFDPALGGAAYTCKDLRGGGRE